MIRFKEAVYQFIQLENNRRLIDTNHSIDRFSDKNRFDDEKREWLKDNIKKVANNLLDKIIKIYKEEEQYYGVHSLSTGIGFVAKLEKDYINNDGRKHLILVTILPIKKFHTFKPDTQKVIVEKRLLSDLYYNHYGSMNENYRPDYLTLTIGNDTFSITRIDDNNFISDINIFEIIE